MIFLEIKQLLTANENKLSKKLNTILKIHTLFQIATGMSNIFLNIFIWKVSNNLSDVIAYNIYSVIAIPILYVIGGWISKRHGIRINLILGMTLYTLFYLFVFAVRNNITSYIPLVGLLRGASAGLYWIAFQVLSYDFSTDKNRDYFFGVQGIINSMTSMITPFVSGYIISRFAGNLGYEIVFVASFIMFFIGSALSFKIPNNYVKSKYYLKSVAALPLKNLNWTKIMVSEWSRGTRDQLMGFLINIMIFMIVGKESSVGNYSFWTFLVATLACYAGGILINHNTRLKYLFIGTISSTIVSSIFIFKSDMQSLWIFGIITAISVNFALIPHNTISWAVIASISKSKERRIEAIVLKEIYLDFGRLVSLAVFYYFSANNNFIPMIIFITGAMQLPMWLLLRKIDTSKIKRHIIQPQIDFENKFNSLSSIRVAGNLTGVH